jgi:hypothetical protein
VSSKQLSLFSPRLWGRDNIDTAWSVDARTATSLVLCIGVLSLVGWLYLTQASQIATTESQMQHIVAEIEKLERANAQLRYESARLEVIPRVEAMARILGLGPMYGRPTYLTVPDTVYDQSVPSVGATIVASTEGPVHTIAAKPESPFTLPSVAELWAEVKAQFKAWIG